MKTTIIRERPDFTVTSYGNGLAYEMKAHPSGASAYFQGEDAERFEAELEALEARWNDVDEALARLWFSYAADFAI